MKFCSNCGSETTRRIPAGDSHDRVVCPSCSTIHYQNPKTVVGCAPVYDKRILLCKRAIEPRKGYWTLPAGFMELGETMAKGAARETWEEACARVEIGHLFAVVDVVQAGQVHVFFTASFDGQFGVGEESLDVRLYAWEDIPWDEIAFPSGKFALRKLIDDAGANNGAHLHEAKRLRTTRD